MKTKILVSLQVITNKIKNDKNERFRLNKFISDLEQY